MQQSSKPGIALMVARVGLLAVMVFLLQKGLYGLGFRFSLVFYSFHNFQGWYVWLYILGALVLMMYFIQSENLRSWHEREQRRTQRIERDLERLRQEKYGYEPRVARYDFAPEPAEDSAEA